MVTVGLLGTGLIGTSIGIGLASRGWKVVGWDPDPGALARAGSIGGITRAADSWEDAVAVADLVVLAGPVSAIVDTLGRISTRAVVTDVAGVKRPVVDAARHLPRFVGGHPMAGREVSGPAGASGSLFHGATWVITPEGADQDAVDTVESMVTTLGAVPVEMSADEHDRAVALSSHLPHLVAAALVGAVADDGAALRLAAGGFRDLTRIAMSDPGWWIEVLLANREAAGAALASLVARLEALRGALEAEDGARLGEVLASARRERAAMGAPVATVGVILEDRPGEIARVGHALSESGVDLRDLQLRHATHGGGGVLTLSVRSEELAGLRRALMEEGFSLLETR
ncbi:MAG: prephenate dehydrogenase [Acidimicrobiia bacterium]|nr:MAG: prephenate dehydrogenase [Acidimicrobiia bacterium]